MENDLKQYLSLFVEETKENLQNMNDALLVLEKDKENLSLINEIFRGAHTLKGMSGTMGFINMSNLTHEMENVLDEVRNGRVNLNGDIIDILFRCFDVLGEMVNYIATYGQENNEENNELIEELQKVIAGNVTAEPNKVQVKKAVEFDEYVLNTVRKAKDEGLNGYKIQVYISPDCVLKSARAFIVLNLLESSGNVVYSNPSMDDIEDEKFDNSLTIALITNLDKEVLLEKLYGISEIEKVVVNSIDIEGSTYEEANNDKKITISPKSNNEAKAPKKDNAKVGKTVRVDIDRLDNLMNLVSELIIIKTRMEDLSNNSDMKEMEDTIEYLERVTTSLHDSVMKVRMVPLERIFNRFPRMVRDLSKELDKKVNFIMHGENTEVDRTVIDEIGDPLIHLIRNSMDHGIEKPEERLKLGKGEEGNLILKAYPDGNSVVIELSDDGRGIDFDKIREKAVEKGLYTTDDIEKLTIDDLKNILFEPGFSTSESINEISGRGVGLDVVKNKIESINGSVELETEMNKGTRFTIRIPLTLAIIEALLVKIADETYAIPINSINEIVLIDKNSIQNLHGQDIILYRGNTIPIIRLDRVMGLESDKSMDEYTAIVVRKGEKQAALIVTSLVGQQEIVIKPLGKYLSNIKMFSGATILGNGNISLIINVNSLL